MKRALAILCLLSPLGCQACGSHTAGPDANPCGLEVRSLPGASTLSARVALERSLDIQEPFDYNFPKNIALFPKANGNLSLFAWWSYHEVDLDGNLVSSVPYADPGATRDRVKVTNVAQGPGVMGALFRAEGGGGSDAFFCLMTDAGVVDIPSCTRITWLMGDSLSWGGDGYTVFSRRQGTVAHALVFGPTGSLLREADLWSNPTTAYAFGDLTSIGNLHVMCANGTRSSFGQAGNSCDTDWLVTFPSSLEPTEVRHTDLLQPNVKGDFCRAVAADDRVAFFHHVRCYRLNEVGRCEDYNESDGEDYRRAAWYLTIVDQAGNPIVLRKPIPDGWVRSVIWDGERFVMVVVTNRKTSAYAFDREGNTILDNVHIPIELGFEPNESLSEPVLTTVGVNDYVMVYGMNPGYRTNFVRFSLPTPPAQAKP